MATRRRSYDRDDDRPHPSPSFSWGNIAILLVVPLLTALVVVIGQWAVQGDTTKRNVEEIKIEKAEREKMRETFMNSQTQLVNVLGKLDSRMSVTEKTQDAMTRQLEKFGDILLRVQPPERRK